MQENIIDTLLDDEALDDEELEEIEANAEKDAEQDKSEKIDLEKLKEISRIDNFIEQAKPLKLIPKQPPERSH